MIHRIFKTSNLQDFFTKLNLKQVDLSELKIQLSVFAEELQMAIINR